ncbi:hypothetical protein J6590_056772 [Homalodisca vitripennis]|nr:hypothetical protein J6590_056772 [Homalodisca vitripennis]
MPGYPDRWKGDKVTEQGPMKQVSVSPHYRQNQPKTAPALSAAILIGITPPARRRRAFLYQNTHPV